MKNATKEQILMPKATKGVENALIQRYGIVERDVPTTELDISETIRELAYATHSYYRYYGKFPSKLAKHFLEKFGTKKSVLFDNYVGSGTSLVEAKLMGIPSFGIDINPVAVLASNVKTTLYDPRALKEEWLGIQKELENFSEKVEEVPSWKGIERWFRSTTIQDLANLKKVLVRRKYKNPSTQDFFLLGFSAIIRRVSLAVDAEIRPHINPKKKDRQVIEAFSKKINEMIESAAELARMCVVDTPSKSYLGSNADLSKFSELKTAGINLVLSHPPYLNCFDYIPVYKLELNWSENIPAFWKGYTMDQIRQMETKSWPATSEKVLFGYFDSNKKVYEEVFRIMEPGGVCGIVIGDSTINKELIRVHKILASICERIGFELQEIIYRTTHYGAGKYAYKHRADYHNTGEQGKKDGIMVLRKPA